MDEINYKDIPLDVVVDDDEFDKIDDVPDSEFKVKQVRSKSSSFPSEYSRDIVVPVFNQGSIGSCVGCSGKVVSTDPNFKGIDLSALWLYKRAQVFDRWKGENYSGTSIIGACRALLQEGICQESYYPYSTRSSSKAKEGALNDALTRRISNFYTMNLRGNTEKIKELIQKQPLWTSFHVHDNFYDLDSDGFLKDEDGYLSSTKKGGHAVAIVGWTYKEGKLYWKFQNSWGKYWGKRGFFYMSDELYRKISKGIYYVSFTGDSSIKESFLSKLLNFPVFIIQNIFKGLKAIFKF